MSPVRSFNYCLFYSLFEVSAFTKSLTVAESSRFIKVNKSLTDAESFKHYLLSCLYIYI